MIERKSMLSKSYELSTVLRAHSDDVKCVFPVSSDCILSASRDRTVAVWQRRDTSKEFGVKRLLEGHDGYVNSLEFIPADADCELDLIVSAGESTIILFHLFDPDPATFPSSEPVDGLIGHHANVCALSYSRKHRKLISASWDCAARVWSRTADRKGKSVESAGQRYKSKAGEWGCELVLSGHEAAVWGVAVLESDCCECLYLTGSADRTLRMYDAEGACVRTFDAFPEAIRSIACFPDFRNVAVALNDGTIRIMNIDDGLSKTLTNHTDYVYHVAVDRVSNIISCGEDHTVAFWDGDEQELQRLVHPCQSVWCCAFLPNGDIVSAGSDHAIRIWSTSEERIAENDMLQNYAREIEELKIDKERKEQKSDGNDLELDIVLEDDRPPLHLRFTKDCDPREVAEAFGKEHDLTEEEIGRIAAFLHDSL